MILKTTTSIFALLFLGATSWGDQTLLPAGAESSASEVRCPNIRIPSVRDQKFRSPNFRLDLFTLNQVSVLGGSDNPKLGSSDNRVLGQSDFGLRKLFDPTNRKSDLGVFSNTTALRERQFHRHEAVILESGQASMCESGPVRSIDHGGGHVLDTPGTWQSMQEEHQRSAPFLRVHFLPQAAQKWRPWRVMMVGWDFSTGRLHPAEVSLPGFQVLAFSDGDQIPALLSDEVALLDVTALTMKDLKAYLQAWSDEPPFQAPSIQPKNYQLLPRLKMPDLSRDRSLAVIRRQGDVSFWGGCLLWVMLALIFKKQSVRLMIAALGAAWVILSWPLPQVTQNLSLFHVLSTGVVAEQYIQVENLSDQEQDLRLEGPAGMVMLHYDEDSRAHFPREWQRWSDQSQLSASLSPRQLILLKNTQWVPHRSWPAPELEIKQGQVLTLGGKKQSFQNSGLQAKQWQQLQVLSQRFAKQSLELAPCEEGWVLFHDR